MRSPQFKTKWRQVLLFRASLVAQTVKNLPAMWETRVQSLGWEDSLEKEMQPTPVFLPGKCHGWRTLVGYSPWGLKESDTTEQLHFHFLLTKWTFVGKLMSLLFTMLSRFVLIFLPRSKGLLISWLQSPSAVILEPRKIKSATVSTVSPLFAIK